MSFSNFRLATSVNVHNISAFASHKCADVQTKNFVCLRPKCLLHQTDLHRLLEFKKNKNMKNNRKFPWVAQFPDTGSDFWKGINFGFLLLVLHRTSRSEQRRVGKFPVFSAHVCIKDRSRSSCRSKFSQQTCRVRKRNWKKRERCGGSWRGRPREAPELQPLTRDQKRPKLKQNNKNPTWKLKLLW